jgi:hypothetical protein
MRESVERDGRLAEHVGQDCRPRADDRNFLDRSCRRGVEVGEDRRKIDFLERRLEHQHARAGAAQHVLEFRRPEAGVHGDQRRTYAGEPEQQGEPLDPVHQPDGNPIAGPDPLRRQPSGGLAAQRVEFGIDDAFLAVDECRRIRPLGEMPVEECRKGQPFRHRSRPFGG